MKTTATETQNVPRIVRLACATTIAAAFTLSLPPAVHGKEAPPHPMPSNIEVPAGNMVFFQGRGVGTQNYICQPSGTGFAWTLFTPQATLFSSRAKQLTTHFFSPNPLQQGTIRAAWQHSKDTSTVWAQLAPNGSSADPNFVAPGAIPWLLLQTAGTQEGPGGGDTLTITTYIQRLNTVGGIAPSTGCDQSTDVGRKTFVPYEADYFFYTEEDRERNH